MNIATADVVSAIVTHTWQLTVLLLAVWALARLLRRRPQLSYVVCLVIVLKCILPPFWSSPTSIFSWLQIQKPVTQTAPPVEENEPDRYAFNPMPVNTSIEEPAAPSIETDAVLRNSPPTILVNSNEYPSENATVLPSPAKPRAADLGTILVVTWLAGACLFLLLWGVQMARFHRRLRRYARHCTDPDITTCVEHFRTQLGVRRRVRVLEANEHFQACSFGVWRPTVLLPVWLLRELSAEQREQVIAHEMIHIRRGDLFHALLQGLAQAVWWFHPLVWWFNRLMIDLRERCCDRELLARLTCSPVGYAECLLQVLKGHRAHHSLSIGLAPHPTMGGSRRFEHTRERIEGIMTEKPQAHRRIRLHHWIVAGLLAAAVLPGAALVVPTHADALPLGDKAEPIKPEKLQPVTGGMVTLDDIDSPSSVDISNDGRFVYMASWSSGTLNVFSRDAGTGKLTLVQSLISGNENEPLDGAVHIHLSPNNQYAAVSCLHAKSFLLYARDAKTGKLSVLDVIRGDQATFNVKPVFYWTSDAVWSPDGKFIYVADAHAPGGNEGDYTGHIVVLQLVNKKLKVVDVFQGTDRCFANARGMAIHPDGVTVFTVSSTAGTLVVMDRDAANGKLSIRQIVDSDAVAGLHGAMQVACSADGQYIYTASGRFKDGNSVCVFKLGSDGKVKFAQSLSNAGGQLPKFEGGNKVRVSPDGGTVYATGTNSNHIAALQRDAKTGKLTLTQLIASSELPDAPKGPNGLAFSPDGKHLYVTWEFSKAVSVFDRVSGGGVSTPRTEINLKVPRLTAEVADKAIDARIEELLKTVGDKHPEVEALRQQKAKAMDLAKAAASAEASPVLITLKHHRADELAKFLAPLLQNSATVHADSITNSLLIGGRKEAIITAREMIERFERLAADQRSQAEVEKVKRAEIEKEKRSLVETSHLRLLELDVAEAQLLFDSADRALQKLKRTDPSNERAMEPQQLAVDKAKIALKRAQLKLEQAKLELR